MALPPPLQTLTFNPSVSLLQTIQDYTLPDLGPMYPPPLPGQPAVAGVSRNTTNSKYPPTTVQRLPVWTITLAHITTLYPRLASTPFDPQQLQNIAMVALGPNHSGAQRLADDTTLLRGFMSPFEHKFCHEAALTSRLDTTVFLELTRILNYIRFCQTLSQGAWEPAIGGTVVYPENGSGVANREGHGFLPDRSAITALQDDPKLTNPRLFADNKPSYKFHSTWQGHARSGFPFSTYYTSKEFKKVLAQVKFYMTKAGVQGGRPLRYGYIVTDMEVVLLRYDPQQGANSIMVSEGFRLRGAGPGAINGLLALVYIHLLASNDQTYRV